MKIGKVIRICCLFAFVAALAGGGGAAFAADEARTLEGARDLNQMPVLTGEQWQTLQPETKMAFIWGLGHVATIEDRVIQRRPELKRKGFAAKLAEGLRGIPMRDIVQEIDAYYQINQDDLDLPVMRVIWAQLVKPKLTAGIADLPVDRDIDK